MTESDMCFGSAQDKAADEVVLLYCPEFRECGCLEEHIFGKLQETFNGMQDALLLVWSKERMRRTKTDLALRVVISATEQHFIFITFVLPC